MRAVSVSSVIAAGVVQPRRIPPSGNLTGGKWPELIPGPYSKFDPQKVHNSLTAGVLRGPGKLAIPPIVFSKHDESEAVAILHLGRALCGHDGIVHGGLICTVFDESLARNVSPTPLSRHWSCR